VGSVQYRNRGTGTAGMQVFACGSGTGFGSGSNIKWNTKVKKCIKKSK
jgi:hypothetical protein